MKKIMTVYIKNDSWFEPDFELKFAVKDLEEAKAILDFMLLNKSKVKRAVVYDVWEMGKEALDIKEML